MPVLNDVFYLGEGDTGPNMDAVIYKADGVTPQDLTGATVTVDIYDDENTKVYDNASVTVVSALLGQIRFSGWSGTDEPGTYYGRFKISIGGKILSAPNDGHFKVKITSWTL